MTISYRELVAPAKIGNREATRVFIISGADDIDAAYADFKNQTAGTFYGLPRADYYVEYFGDGNNFRGTVNYASSGSSAAAQQEPLYTQKLTFSTGGGTQHITRALATTVYPASGATLPDNGTLINVRDGVAQGVEIDVPMQMLALEFTVLQTDVDSSYIGIVTDTTGYINDDAWFNGYFEKGSVKFLGAELSQTSTSPVIPIKLNFAIQKGATNQTIDGITGINYYGWDYVEMVTDSVVDQTANKLTIQTQGIKIHQTYGFASFNDLVIQQPT